MKRSPHFISESPEYSLWEGMKARCLNPNNSGFKYYGARGITVCDRWRKSFQHFISDMGERPSRQHSLDRIDNNGNYEPGNCRWATTSEQADNKRSSKFVIYRGTSTTISQAIRLAGSPPVSRRVAVQRLKLGWTVEDAVETPTSAPRRERAMT